MNSMNKILSTVILLGFILLCGCNTQPSPIRSGELWPDNNGGTYQCPWRRSDVS